MALKRTEFWAERELHDFLLQHADEAFAWGKNDCCLFPATAIEAFTGTDLASAFRAQYDSEATAFALIRNVTGGSTVADAAAWCAKQHGLEEWPYPLQAQRGDLVVAENGGRLIAGLVHLSGRQVVSVSETGLVRLPLKSVQRAWKV